MSTAALLLSFLIAANDGPFDARQGFVALPIREVWTSNRFIVYADPWKIRKLQYDINTLLLPDWKEITDKNLFWVPSYPFAVTLKERYDNAVSGKLELSDWWFNHHVVEELGVKIDYLPTIMKYDDADPPRWPEIKGYAP